MGRIKLDGYIRVSRVGGRSGDSFISPDVQRQQIERWAALRDAVIVEWHIDLDQSGAKDDRPGMVTLLERIERGETGGVIVAKLDRFARSLTGALEAIRRIDEAGGTFVSVAEGIDPTTSAGKLQQNIMLVFAEFELDRIRDNWRVAQQRAVERGVHVASRVPTGYQRGTEGRLEPSGAADAIADAFAMRAAGQSWAEIAEHLTARGVVTPYGSTHWTTSSVSKVLRNRVYLGEARSGSFVNADAHAAIVSRSTWEAAQGVRAVTRATSSEPSLLAGLLRCAGCRYAMKPDRMRLRTGERARIYRCRGEHAAGRCEDRCAVMGRVIEPFIERQFLAAAAGIVADPTTGTEVEEAREALMSAEAELRSFRDDSRILGALGQDGFVEGLTARAAAVDEAATRLGDLQRRADSGARLAHADLATMWPELPVAAKRRLLAAAYDAVFIRSGRGLAIEDRVVLLFNGEAPTDLPSRGRRVALAGFVWPDAPAGAGEAISEDA